MNLTALFYYLPQEDKVRLGRQIITLRSLGEGGYQMSERNPSPPSLCGASEGQGEVLLRPSEALGEGWTKEGLEIKN